MLQEYARAWNSEVEGTAFHMDDPFRTILEKEKQ